MGTTRDDNSGAKLQVNGLISASSSGTGARHIFVGNTNGYASLYVNSSGNRGLYDATNGKWMLYTDGTNMIMPNGNILIGTATDSGEKLQVNGALRIWRIASSAEYCNIEVGDVSVNYKGYDTGDGYVRHRFYSNDNLLMTLDGNTKVATFSGAVSISGAVTMASSLSVGGNIGFSQGFAYNLGTNAAPASILYTTAVRCAVNGTLSLGNDNGLWAQFASSGALTVYKDTAINGNLVVAGDISA